MERTLDSMTAGMGNEINSSILLGRGKGGIHMILHIPMNKIHSCLDYPYGRLNVLNYLVHMQPLVLLEDNVHVVG